MANFQSLSRFGRRVAVAPWLIENSLSEIADLRSEFAALREDLNSISEAQTDALDLLARAIEDLSRRISEAGGLDRSASP